MQQTIVLIIGGISGAITTFFLQKWGLSVVIASCIVGLIGALVGHFTKSAHLPLILFAGSFIGMTSTSIGTVPLMILAGALSGIIYKLSQNIDADFGGRLGVIAFVSTVISFYILLVIKKLIPIDM
jgi:uncharacterized membrane protein YeaQ/YmgE (transglycosylase-associated protein family)